MAEWNKGLNKAGQKLTLEPEKAVLVAVCLQGQTDEQVNEYLNELEFLALTAGAQTHKRFIQKMTKPEPRTFIGSGKVQEVRDYVERHEIELVIFDDDLTGKQTNILEEILKVKILDRSSLILDIFATRAQTAQAKAQVELAQLQYLLPRLRGLWTHLERQKGGIGMRGPGEQEIETDRRIVRDQIDVLKDKLKIIDKQSQTQRKTRGQMVRVSLVGYTNVGKSTIMNAISKSEVLAENKLFATLDTTVRKVVLEQTPFLLSDTVGFIRKLPHNLIESFKSTLDEVRESDILLHVVDISHPQYEDQIGVVTQTLLEIGAADKPVYLVFNKMDAYREKYFDPYLPQETRDELENDLRNRWIEKTEGRAMFLSAKDNEGLDEFRLKIVELVSECYLVRYPHQTKSW